MQIYHNSHVRFNLSVDYRISFNNYNSNLGFPLRIAWQAGPLISRHVYEDKNITDSSSLTSVWSSQCLKL